MPRNPLDGKLVFIALALLLLSGLFIVPSFSVPSIGVRVQPVGACTAEPYWIDVNVTNLENRPLENYTFNVTIPSDRIPAYSSLPDKKWKKSVYVVDGSGNPLYYWVMRKTDDVFTVFFRVPHIDANGWALVRVYYGSSNPYGMYRRPSELFVYFEPFNQLKNYPHVDSGIFDNSLAFGGNELKVSSGRLWLNSTLAPNTAKEAELTDLTVDDAYRIVFKFHRKAGSKGKGVYPFYMFIHADLYGLYDEYDYLGIHRGDDGFHFEFGNDWTGPYETASAASKRYYLGEILVSRDGSWGRVEDFPSGSTVGSYAFEELGLFDGERVSVGFGQANSNPSSTVNLLALVDWVYIVRRAEYTAEVVGMGAECGFD